MLQIPEPKIAVPPTPRSVRAAAGAVLAALVGDDPADERVTLVCAPGGYGKTTLLAHWALAAGRTGPGLAWVNLDRGDDDPRRLWTGILAALTDHPGLPGRKALCTSSPVRRPSVEESGGRMFFADLLDALDGLPTRVPPVRHDVHELAAPAALRGLQTIVAARPLGLRLVLSSRLDPLLSLGTLRSAGGLRELRADRLRFSADEAGAVLEQQGLRLTPAQTRELHACTGGWPTAVHLVGTVPAPVSSPTHFSPGSPRPPGPSRISSSMRFSPASPIGTGSSLRLSPRTTLLPYWPTQVREWSGLARMTGLLTPVHGPLHGYRVDPLVAAHLRTERGHRSRSTVGPHGRAAGSGRGEDDPVVVLQRAVRGGDDALIVQSVRRFAEHGW